MPVTDAITGAPTGESGLFNLPAVVALVAVTALLVVGVSKSATVNNIIVLIKVSVVIAFIIVGIRLCEFLALEPAYSTADSRAAAWHRHEFMGTDQPRFGRCDHRQQQAQYGIGGVITGAAKIFFAYLGFEAVSTAGAESKNPKRDMPIGILGSLAICTVLYILTAGVLVGVVPYAQPQQSRADRHCGQSHGPSVVCGVGEAWCALRPFLSDARLALRADPHLLTPWRGMGLLPSVFGRVHWKLADPMDQYAACWRHRRSVCRHFWYRRSLQLYQCRHAGGVRYCLSDGDLSPTFKSRAWSGPFRTPLFPVVPILGAAMCVLLLMSIMADVKTRYFFAWYLGIGVPVYFLYGIRKSKLQV